MPSMPRVVDDFWLGRRVVVRRRAGTGPEGRPAYSDALGELIEVSAQAVVLDTRGGPVRVARADIATARLVLASTAGQLALEATAARGWRAAHVETNADGWLLRADSGWTGRANSALPLRTLRRPLDEALADLSAWYRGHGLAPMIQVPLPAAAALDRALDARGWTYPEDVDVLVARLDLLLRALGARPAPAGIQTSIVSDPDADWLTSYHYRGGVLPASAAALLVRHDTRGFATMHDTHGSVLGSARGVVDDGWLGLTALEVAPPHRRRGLAGLASAALAHWARDRGAVRCYVQVSAGNTAALALYRRLGFYEHHSYRYRIPPTIES